MHVEPSDAAGISQRQPRTPSSIRTCWINRASVRRSSVDNKANNSSSEQILGSRLVGIFIRRGIH